MRLLKKKKGVLSSLKHSKTIIINVNNQLTILDIKERIRIEEGIEDINNIILYYTSKNLQDNLK